MFDESIGGGMTPPGGPGGSATILNRYLHGEDVDQVFADENVLGEVLWSLTDHQGTVRDVVSFDSNQTTVENHLKYDSFGNITHQSDSTQQPLYAFTGREWDADSELSYHRARWYDPTVGKFLSEDPIGFDGGDVNLARYVSNNPLNFTDPTGQKARDVKESINIGGGLTGAPQSNIYTGLGSVPKLNDYSELTGPGDSWDSWLPVRSTT